MMSKRLISNRPSDLKPLKQVFWENAEKARMGDYWKDKKSYRELSEATGIPSGSLRMLFMNKPKGNIPKIVTITNGLAKVTKKISHLVCFYLKTTSMKFLSFQESLTRSRKTCGIIFVRNYILRRLWMLKKSENA